MLYTYAYFYILKISYSTSIYLIIVNLILLLIYHFVNHVMHLKLKIIEDNNKNYKLMDLIYPSVSILTIELYYFVILIIDFIIYI